MFRQATGLAILFLAVACSDAPPATSSPGSPAATELALAANGEAYVVTILNADRPFFDVRVEAVAPTGVARPIASFAGVHPAGWREASPYYDMRSLVGPTGLMTIVAERNGGENRDDIRTVVLDLRSTAAKPVEVAGPIQDPSWSPDGQLATVEGDWALVDLRTGIARTVTRPPDVELSLAWIQDGSGWLAYRLLENGGSIPGVLSATGAFHEGVRAPFEVTGRERMYGAEGGGLDFGVSDGPTGSETVIIETRSDLPPPCHCTTWVSTAQPGDGPSFEDAEWDAAGRGIWTVFARDGRHWLSHIVKPKVDGPVADLPHAESWTIEGISADDRWVAVASEDTGSLVVVDTGNGATREIARLQGGFNPTPMFGGWVH